MQIHKVFVCLSLGCTAQLGCNLVDDEPPTTSSAGGSSGEGEDCLEDAAEAIAACQPPLQSAIQWVDAGGSMVLIDDPAATVGIGPGGWLVQVASAADFIGTFEDNGGTCSYSCAWCQPGQSFCHTGLTSENFPLCGQCLPFDTPDIGSQCAAVIAACHSSTDATGGTDSGGLDETGADSSGDSGDTALGAYSCADWSPDGAVETIGPNTVRIDAAVVNEIFEYSGVPLSECDGTRFRHRGDGYFEVSRQAASGLLAQLGFQPGDVFRAYNGKALGNLDALVHVFAEFSADRPSQFTITFQRGPKTIHKLVQVQ